MTTIIGEIDDSIARLSARLQAQLARPGMAMDAYFYRSALVYQRELSELIFRSWIFAGHVSEVANSGDYFLLELGEESLIITRDGAGEIHALVNVCRHRGARLCDSPRGHCGSFVCPYHGWTYAHDGRLKSAREMDALEDFEAADYGLKRARVVVFMGLVFINCDPKAADFRTALQHLAPSLGAYDLAGARIAHKHTYRLGVNWKLALENYLECYHCATSHRAYARSHSLSRRPEKVQAVVAAMLQRSDAVTGIEGMGDSHRRIYLGAEGFGACAQYARYGLLDGSVTGSEDGRPLAPLMGRIRAYDGGVGDYQMGPLTFMLNYPDYCVLYRILPSGLDATDMELVWFVNGDAQPGRDYDRDALTWLWHRTTLEDEYIVGRNSAGLHSRFFEPGPYHPEFEHTLQQFVAWYLQSLAASVEPG